MLRPEDERAIEDLFERLRRVEHNSGPRDVEAETLIRQRLSENPGAAYFMAQTIIVQEAALREQQARLEKLEAEAERGRSGFLGGIFGGEAPQREPQRRSGPWDRPEGGGFLAGAAQTAMGVTGGLLLGSAIAVYLPDLPWPRTVIRRLKSPPPMKEARMAVVMTGVVSILAASSRGVRSLR